MPATEEQAAFIRISIAVKRHHGHDNSYEEKH